MKKRNLIVFDIDGTLTDTVDLHQQAFKHSLRHIGVQTFNDAFGTYKHHTDHHIAKAIFELATSLAFEETTSMRFEEHLLDHISQAEIKEIGGALQLVKAIENQTDFGVCYATGSLFKPAQLKLQRIGINFNPAQLVASNQLEEREKIVEQAITNARKFYGVEQFGRIISFGDGLWDLKTAQNLQLEFVGVGNRNKAVLETHGMQKHYADFYELKLEELFY